MEITLEKIELVKDRTGVSYKDAKEALENADGSVVDAIINIEETIDSIGRKKLGAQSMAIMDAITELVKKGNVSKISIKKKDGEVVLNLPVNAGLLGVVLAPGGVLAGVIAAFAFKCTVEIIKTDGTIIDVSDRASEAVNKAVEKGSELKETAKQKTDEVREKVKGNETFDKAMGKAGDAKDKASDAFEKARDKAQEKTGEAKEKAHEKAEEAKKLAQERAEEARKKALEKAEEAKKMAQEKAEAAKDKAGDAFDKAKDAVKDTISKKEDE